jgi:hypothetical protein
MTDLFYRRLHHRCRCQIQSLQRPNQCLVQLINAKSRRRNTSRHALSNFPIVSCCPNPAEEDLGPPHRAMGKCEYQNLWLCQRLNEHCHYSSHTYLPVRLPCPIQQDVQMSFPVGGQGRSQSIPSIDSQLHLSTRSHYILLAAIHPLT